MTADVDVRVLDARDAELVLRAPPDLFDHAPRADLTGHTVMLEFDLTA